MTTKTPKVSFLALCFNHAPYLAQCLDSIEAQAWPNAELVILDNASSDGSAELIQAWAERSSMKPKLLLQQELRGVCANINTLISHATGDYLAWIATDDYWLPQKTATQVAVMEGLGPEVAVTYADALQIDADGKELKQASFIKAHREFPTLPSGDILQELLRGPFIPAMSSMVRRSALEAIGPFDESLIYEDYDSWLRIAEHRQFHADPTPLCAYRVLDTSMIRTVAAQDRPEKVLSDARIMAKVTRMERLDQTTLKNTKRRVLKLAIRLVGMPGDWRSDLLHLQDVTGLRSLFLLAAAHRNSGQVAEDRCHSLLAAAAEAGYLASEEVRSLPKPVASKIQGAKISPSALKLETPESWEKVYPSLLEVTDLASARSSSSD